MCGIAGIIGKNIENNKKVIGDMVSAIIHRGPDDDGFFVDENVGVGMRRLSIIDLARGKQPIWSADGKRVIFFNGEIYNYKELKKDLVLKGYQFKTDSDTEVILVMYEAYGKEMLPRLRGMFTFCIYNTEAAEIFLARDFFGIKPLYYLRNGGNIIAFSSEIKSFLSIPGFKAEVNDNAVYNYLSFQYNPLDETFFKNVYKLPPAHYLKINLKTRETEMKKYWSFEFNQQKNLDEKKTAEKIYDTMNNSVRHHMIADVPVGAFLSGGVDSSIITTLMQRVSGSKKIKTFTVGFDTLTEGVESKQTSDYLQTDHTEIIIGPNEYFNALSDAVYHFDEPIADPSAIGLYFLAREARKHVKVVLSGEGADELFGGYNIYLAPFASQKLKWIHGRIYRSFLCIICILLKLSFEFFGKNFLRRVSMKLEDWYFGNAYLFKSDEIKKLCSNK
ncbi:MAG: asparagine synthase (glutamine-hydrolyzing), partial [Candidatus Zambryskibacteria bacterium]|nr:asparagine synthase (glutamine-hydrolyzing) [Candidatus Zambryskibacteria bacterium]